ncbi:MAG: biotin/lipoyl-binding protein [Rhodoferax sp.]|nr:MAG: biotin/lipoyl-binding protein [Rhodoferax sp.]
MHAIHAPLHAQIVQWLVEPGQPVAPGDVLLILEAMKMEHEVRAEAAGVLGPHFFVAGESVEEGVLLSNIERLAQSARGLEAKNTLETEASAQNQERADLARLQQRLAFTLDAARPDAVAKRHAQGQRTARENIAALVDPGSFVEYGALAVAAQRSRRSEADLIANTPADGMVCGIGTVHGKRTVVMAYDATVLAGTQGMRNHQKTDRMLGLALQHCLPVVLLAEGGGGRPGDVDMPIVAGLHVTTFASFARLNGRVPVVGMAAGRCFAGNAALLGCCDVVIATKNSNIGMGGPAMVEGGGLGTYRPEDIGPARVQHANGVIDVLVDDEVQAVAMARRYLAYFQGTQSGWQAPDAAALRAVVPENRLRVYDTRQAVEGVADVDSVLYLRSGFGVGIHTALVRIEGRPVGVLANNPAHLGGAIDADAADKAARFLQLCNAHGLPLLSFVDTPGFMVGPATEATAQVRHVSRMFIAAAHLRVPFVSVVLRKGYGLGAMAMTAGGFHAPLATAAWPSAEFGAMGLEGAVRLGYRKELEALPEGAQRQARFDQLLAQHVEAGSALNMATTLEIDTVIDPADTRSWLAATLAAGQVAEFDGFGAIDTW